jgi:hypothetical protein
MHQMNDTFTAIAHRAGGTIMDLASGSPLRYPVAQSLDRAFGHRITRGGYLPRRVLNSERFTNVGVAVLFSIAAIAWSNCAR